MGNRAVITCSTSKVTGVGIYVHWNGGLESVLAFLEVCKQRNYRSPESDPSYFMARLSSVICEFFDGGDSVGLGQLRELDCDNWDNGVYVVGGDFEVVDRWGKGSDPHKSFDALSDAQKEKFHGIVEQLTKHLLPA